jgi:colanic acid/amylovoran biosynthesis glycosyltransferase
MQACRLIEKKGVATSLRAFAIFKKDHPNAEFVIAGKGPLQPELQMLAAGLGISRDVHFVGFVPTEKLNELYASAHLFVHPSETPPDENQEGVPNSILEAMATGLVVAATQHGGIPEAVEHGRTGWLVPEEDHVALAKAMHRITKSNGELDAMSRAATRAVRERFEQRAQTRMLEGFYEEAIALSKGAQPVSEMARETVPEFAEPVAAS